MPCDIWCSEFTCEQADCSSCGPSEDCARPAGWVAGPECHSWCDGSGDPDVCLTLECSECGKEQGCPEPTSPPPPAAPQNPRPPPPPTSPSPPPTACAPPGHSPEHANCVVPEWLCCEDLALQCFRKQGPQGTPYGYGQCLDACPAGWDCEVLRKPSPAPPPQLSPPPPPVPRECAESGESLPLAQKEALGLTDGE